LRWIALIAGAACSAAPAPTTTPLANVAPTSPTVESPGVIVNACVDQRMKAALKWPAARYRGLLFVLADEGRYLATVRISNHTLDCGSCEGPTVFADVVDRAEDLQPTCSYAFGPVSAPRPRARVRSANSSHNDDVSSAHEVTSWLPSAEIDLDGDGRAELTEVARCARTTPSGCSDHVCNRVCKGLRSAGDAEPAPASVHCWSFLPDVEDCTP
jgi:hypothetical protein